MSIQVNNLTKKFGTQIAVNALSFTISKGEIVGFLGPNGAGKSTTMKMLTGYLQANSGEAIIGGLKMHPHALAAKNNIGYLPESNALYTDMYVREYLQFVAKIYGLKNTAKQVEASIATVGLGPEANKKIGQLSKGYKQRVGLAAALIHNPAVLILDEPTSGLDPNQIVEIRQVIKQLGQNKTVLFSSHILQEIQAICSRVIIINKGNLVADDVLENLQRPSANTLWVSFSTQPAASILQNIPNITSVLQKENNQWQFEGSNVAAIRKQVMQLAIHHNLNITSIQEAGSNLEEIFRNLTIGNNN